MPRLLLTGANGFVGKFLIDRARRAGHQVIALTGHSPLAEIAADEQITADIRDPQDLARAVAQAQPTHIVHLAAISHVPTSFREPLRTWQTNVMGSMNLLEAIRLHVPDAFVLFASSSEVYGAAFKSGQPVDEQTRCEPLNPYAASKLAAESAFQEYFRQGIKGVIARPFNHIGAQQSPDFVTASFARQIALIESGQQVPVLKVGNLEASRDFLDVQDVCSAYLAVLTLAGSRDYPRCMNIASGQPHKISDVLGLLLSLSTAKIRVEVDSEKLRPSDIQIAAGDNQRLREATGWKPVIALEQTLHDLLDYWRLQVSSTTNRQPRINAR
ncbi:GDP-mannose 4,6-dehydratase [Pseudomonas sp. CCC3.2]|uniref:GDP-mannose 4,6-dehydratase n=1 Tax=unclassified Pseudomonas TaxID=196821 RepID=UPI002AB360EE|nr:MULTISPECIES: GDP-mannose 4,6-dehydratase [unclassified Pseudomonas]MDY7561389.1 GDP-mannose 4,6-dehydratase [Pseudomonas sp. AB6]MEA9978469.1 GDP-mannose 4,6-dehydratase [Pseudomonas sp. RTS4]MEB0182666.1 GDP-mannose 4,6-dehydratase [Pseudomonas sp. CCC3.2]MEB0199013.1 GDP-mannose 4,6-dehydratase [Pseudomonas sp. 5S4]MEB0213502.1 GDP-mannose 4,6-dehydratase [Pseudomonas sp. AB6]